MLAVKSMQWRRRCRDVAACRKYFHTGTSRGSRHPPIIHQRCAHGYAASRGSQHTAAANMMCYSNYRGPCSFSSTNFNKCCQHSRSFSKFSPEEVVIQDPPPPPPPTSSSSPLKNIKAAPASSITSTSTLDQPSLLSPESPQSTQPQKIPTEDKVTAPKESANNNKFLLDELHDAQELFHRIYAEAKALLRNNKNSTTSEEIVAMADYFMILVNSLDLEKSLETIQSLQTTTAPSLLKEKEQEGNIRGEINRLRDGEGKEEVEEKLRQAVKSMSELHHVFLTMVESALPPSPPMFFSKQMDAQSKTNDALDDDDSAPSFDKELYTSSTVGRALQLSRRAVELGMPMHRPLFQRMAIGVVLTASFPVPLLISSKPSLPPADEDSAESTSTQPASTTEAASVILPGQYPQIKEGLQQPTTPPIALKLLGIYHHARTALNISSGDQLHHLAMELLAGPFLLLLEQKRWEEAMGLLRGWRRAQFGNNAGKKFDLLGMLGENNTLNALEIAKGWLVGDDTDFAEEVQSNAYVMDLTTLLEESVAEILEGRKQQEEKLTQLLWQLSLRSDDDDDNLGAADSDSDSDFEDDFDYDSDEEEDLDTPNPAPTPIEISAVTDVAPSDSPVIRAQSDPQREVVWHNENTLTLSSRAEDTTTPAKSDNAMGEAGESTIIRGLSNKEARECIYLRNGGDWVLPDIVPTLEEWNKGNQLTFTPEFERYLGRQIMRDAITDDDDDDED